MTIAVDPGGRQVPDLPAGVPGPGQNPGMADQFSRGSPQVSCSRYSSQQSQYEAAIRGGKTPGVAECRDNAAVPPECLPPPGLWDDRPDATKSRRRSESDHHLAPAGETSGGGAVPAGVGDESRVGEFPDRPAGRLVEDTSLLKGSVMKPMNRILAVVAAVSLVTITGCAAETGSPSAPPAAAGSSVPSADGPATASEGVITIRDFAYIIPASVRPGSMVTVTNADDASHTLTAKDQGGFDIEAPGGGTVIFQAPQTPGEYGFICTFHPQMKGMLVVE